LTQAQLIAASWRSARRRRKGKSVMRVYLFAYGRYFRQMMNWSISERRISQWEVESAVSGSSSS